MLVYFSRCVVSVSASMYDIIVCSASLFYAKPAVVAISVIVIDITISDGLLRHCLRML